MSADFYYAFEEAFRGSRDVVIERLAAYQSFILPLRSLAPGAMVTDLGCGRGEWLEWMGKLGFAAHGVDLDQSMLAVCQQHGLSATHADALSHLTSLPSESQLVVSAFHLIEHIAFPEQQRLISEALRVLKPGGLLILETPNPENLVVSSCSFHLDPTHLKPLPPDLLVFLTQHAGFERAQALRLQETAAVAAGGALSLWDVLGGVSADIAVVAQKAGNDALRSALHAPFAKQVGVSLMQLAARYQQQEEARLVTMEARLADAVALATEARDQSHQHQQALMSLLHSKSWRVTAPLRWCMDWWRAVRGKGRSH